MDIRFLPPTDDTSRGPLFDDDLCGSCLLLPEDRLSRSLSFQSQRKRNEIENKKQRSTLIPRFVGKVTPFASSGSLRGNLNVYLA